MGAETRDELPPWKATIVGDAVTGYRVSVQENLCGTYYNSREFRPRRTSTLWGARRVAARMLRRAKKSDETSVREVLS